jgi:hypothetical protein
MKKPAGVLLVVLLVSLGCARTDSPRRDHAPAGPGPGDSLAKLARRLLTDPDPAMVYQAITCEHIRLGKLYGPYKADSIGREVEDTTYSWRDQSALRQVDAKLANHVFRSECASPGTDSSLSPTQRAP